MQVFMLSNGKLPTSKVLLEFALPEIKASFLKQNVQRVVVIPYAVIRLSYDERVNSVRDSFSDMPLDIKGIHEFKDPVEGIEWADAILVSGGNTWYLNKSLHDFGLIEPIRKAVLKQNKVYVGWSAGTVICAPTMCTTNDMCIVDAAITSSLNFVPFQINPHYIDATIENHMGETRDERILEYCIRNPHQTVVGIPEGSWLHLHDDGLDYHCPAAKPYAVFKYGKEKQTCFQENMSQFLE
ncbi:dipeptidase E [Actinobacillus delphinicola]|uniref:Peptidase E n=1 Tax=Actinobacillus delphinicola TaxID=51161 RepID=A0A448TT81_9PAST|nr:dipeptidase PepE [Actinobacillus delphinicola]MDG6897577.1 dipeptidase E [Actinobacillus delphinicola]VEJ09199.1 peptidase E [Actinobacillus delphinicola]